MESHDNQRKRSSDEKKPKKSEKSKKKQLKKEKKAAQKERKEFIRNAIIEGFEMAIQVPKVLLFDCVLPTISSGISYLFGGGNKDSDDSSSSDDSSDSEE